MIAPTIVTEADELITAWVSKKLGIAFGKTMAIGIVKDGRIVAGVVYSGFKGYAIEASIVSEHPSWATRKVLFTIFAYPFNQLGVRRLQATVSKRNKRARKFVERLGFVMEGVGRQAWPNGDDAVVYSMLRHECKWIKPRARDLEVVSVQG